MPETPHRRRFPIDRRSFLRRAALVGGLGVAAPQFLIACSRDESNSSTAQLTIATPDNPVKWPITEDNAPIPAGREPERNATLQLYNYADYMDPAAIKSFEKKYAAFGVKVALSTFNDTDEALTKIRAGGTPFDLFFPSYDQLSRLVTAKLIRPLTHDYVPNIKNVWPQFTDPWYDQGWQYTVPYTVYTTGIGWRTDQVREDVAARANPYDVLWDPKYRGRTAVLDDWHTCMAMALLRSGSSEINSGDQKVLDEIAAQLTALQKATKPKVTITMYNDLPAGQLGVAQMWSGDVVNAVSYLPSGVGPEILRYWFPSDGKGSVDNDLMVVLRGGKNPVLAHLFVNHMLDNATALANFSFIGYQPPQTSIEPTTLVQDEYLPSNLASATVLPKYFDVGYRLLELPTDVDAKWHTVWQEFKAGA
ncbi:polyamine ABC transporter substrate-binding protein [Cryptosporangium aurantiacum]|uniref:Spermidine/putrescine transport system substrate-binding protein n=1 Tax=Cryptosporangium aurantiacum TaxID=134849 RepID=A0A1M7M9R0_9ACTN|nr:spermidine/putrescine ABC transporter substrate-binding protein [Cryptosporangium aurantiacum]SHM87455.1 spermidine/putrescine transport system substrate-binding protein [Cryptosporangium aurantiacum]